MAEISAEAYSAEIHNAYAKIVAESVEELAKARALNNQLNEQLAQARETIQSLSGRVTELEQKEGKK